MLEEKKMAVHQHTHVLRSLRINLVRGTYLMYDLLFIIYVVL